MLEVNILALIAISIVVFIALFILLFLIYRNKFVFLNIKIDEAERQLDCLLAEKRKLLYSICDSIDELVDKSLFPDLDKINEKTDRFTLSNTLYDMEIELSKVMNYRRSFVADEEISKLMSNLDNISIDCLSTERYYNDKVNESNRLLEHFPSRLIGKMTGNSKKEIFEHKEEEVFEILKDK